MTSRSQTQVASHYPSNRRSERLHEMTDFYDRGPSDSIPDSEIGRAVARQLISSFNGEDRTGRPGDAIVLARAVGVTVLAIEQMTGWARQTVYRHRDTVGDPREIESSQARFELLVLTAARGRMTIADAARALALPTDTVRPAALYLDAEKLASVEPGDTDDPIVGPTEGTYLELRRYFNRHIQRTPAGYIVCLQLSEHTDPAKIRDAAEVVLGSSEAAVVVGPETVHTEGDAHELLLPVAAPTLARAMTFAYSAWPQILEKAGVPVEEARIRDVFSPGTAVVVGSPCLDQLMDTLRHEDAGIPDKLHKARVSYSGDLGEKGVASKCLTEAAVALRRATGQERNPRLIASADDAFDELLPARGPHLDKRREKIQAPVVKALELASRRLGPYLGGEVGSFKAPGGRPSEPKSITPTLADLIEMVELCAQAIAEAGRQGYIDVDASVERIVDSSYQGA